MLHATFAAPCLTTFCRLDELGLEAVGQLVNEERAVIECRVIEPDPWCRKCGAEGVVRDTVARRLAHEPFGHRPTTLLVRVRRYRCDHCRRTWRQDVSKAAAPRAKISRRGLGWALEAIVVDRVTVSRAAAGLGVSWHTANTAILAEGKRRLIDDPTRFDGVTTIGVDEHVWRHTRFGDKVRHSDHRPHPEPEQDRPGHAAGHGRGPVQGGIQAVARRPSEAVAGSD